MAFRKTTCTVHIENFFTNTGHGTRHAAKGKYGRRPHTKYTCLSCIVCRTSHAIFSVALPLFIRLCFPYAVVSLMQYCCVTLLLRPTILLFFIVVVDHVHFIHAFIRSAQNSTITQKYARRLLFTVNSVIFLNCT